MCMMILYDPFSCSLTRIKPLTVKKKIVCSITSTPSRREYWAFYQHCLLTDAICLHKMLLTFLTTAMSDLSFLKFFLRFCISSVSAFIIYLSSCNFKNNSINWVLFNALSVSSVYVTAILSRNVTMIQNS